MYHARLIKGKISHRDTFIQRASVYGWPFLTASKSLPFLCKPAWPVSLSSQKQDMITMKKHSPQKKNCGGVF